MTEEEWLNSEGVVELLTQAERWSSERKRRLFLLDCAQRACYLPGMGTRRHSSRDLLTDAYEVVEGGEVAESVVALFNRARR